MEFVILIFQFGIPSGRNIRYCYYFFRIYLNHSLLNAYDEGGWMPKWPNPGYSSVMLGAHADAIITDAKKKS